MGDSASLKRTITLPQMVLYGLGTTIGAGIYALVGELARVSGMLAPAAFLFAAILAGFTALSFAELSGRYPRAAGASLYIREGFGSERLSVAAGLMMVLAGLVSASALVNGFSGYFETLTGLPRLPSILLITLLLGAVAAWGIAESVLIATAITVVEVGGLVWLIIAGSGHLAELPSRWPELLPALSLNGLAPIYAGALLAFFAFLGFEDMVDVAEEVKDVKHTLPLAIVLTLVITTMLYLLIMVMAVLALPPGDLAASRAPIATLYHHYTGREPMLMSLIGMFAIINGGLIQIIMASRVLYGLSSRGLLPKRLAHVHPRTQTPLRATAVAVLIVLTFALTGRLAGLAAVTSVIMLTLFSAVNLALWRIKQRQPQAKGVLIFPRWMSLTAAIISLGLVGLEVAGWLRQ